VYLLARLGEEEWFSTAAGALLGIEPRHGLWPHIQSIAGIKRPECKTDHKSMRSFMYAPFTFHVTGKFRQAFLGQVVSYSGSGVHR
jgi:hypothetical protein